MTLKQMQALITVALPGTHEPLMGTIPALINEALNQIQQRRSFNCMRTTFPFTLNVSGSALGPYTQVLPANFKESQSGYTTLRNVSTEQYIGAPWRIWTKQEVQRNNLLGVNVSDRMAYIDQDSTGVWTMYFPGPLTQGYLTPIPDFEFDIFAYLPAVAADTDENDLMRKYPMLVIEYAKWLVFSLGSDDESKTAKVDAMSMINGRPGFPGYFAQASNDDASHKIRGRTSRMGGF